MTLIRSRDREFRFPPISYLDYKVIEMERVLTGFLARLRHDGHPSRISRSFDLEVDRFVEAFLERPEWFQGFGDHPETTRRWVETYLLDLVNRGRAGEAVAGPRPLHGFAYRFRNTNHSRPYGADEHLYELMHWAREGRGEQALGQLKRFFFEGIDPATGQTDASAVVDVETQALMRLTDQVRTDVPDASRRESRPPLCIGSADLLADDVVRLLCYRAHIPRVVMVDYLKILLAFHLAIFHLRLLKLLPALVRRKGGDPICARERCPMSPMRQEDPHGACPYRVRLLVDVGGDPRTPMARLAERSAESWYRRIPGYVLAHFTVRRLDDFARHMVRLNKLTRPPEGFSVADLLALLDRAWDGQRQPYFLSRLASVLDESSASEEERDPRIGSIIDLGLPAFDSYLEILMAERGDFQRGALIKCLDSLQLKNRPGGLLAQSRAKGAPRRFVLDSRLLEVLVQIAVLEPGGVEGFHTRPLQIDALLGRLRERYGLHVDRLPAGDGFGQPGIDDREALASNRAAFATRLRELGFHHDLSDAHVNQTVSPRFGITKDGRPVAPGGES